MVQVVDIASGTPTKSYKLHADRLNGLEFSRDSKTLASFGNEGTCALWNVEDGKLKHRLESKGGPILAVAFSSDGKQIATSGQDPSIQVWNVVSGVQASIFRSYSADIQAVAFTNLNAAIISGDHSGKLLEWPIGETKAQSIKVSPALIQIELDGQQNRLLAADLKGWLKA